MFENEQHQKAYALLSKGQFRKAHIMLHGQMDVNMNGLIWVDYLYLQTIVHPNQFDTGLLEDLQKNKPEWLFMVSLNDRLQANDLTAANELIYLEFDHLNTGRQIMENKNLTPESIQQIIDFKNRPV